MLITAGMRLKPLDTDCRSTSVPLGDGDDAAAAPMPPSDVVGPRVVLVAAREASSTARDVCSLVGCDPLQSSGVSSPVPFIVRHSNTEASLAGAAYWAAMPRADAVGPRRELMVASCASSQPLALGTDVWAQPHQANRSRAAVPLLTGYSWRHCESLDAPFAMRHGVHDSYDEAAT